MIIMENFKINKKEKNVTVKIDPKIYPLPIIYQAADVLIDRFYVFLDGNPEKEIIVTIKPKNDEDLEEIAGEFNNELINYTAFLVRASTNRDLRELMLKRAFFSVTDEKEKEEKFQEKLMEKQKIDIGAKVPIYPEIKMNEQKETSGIENEVEEFSAEEIAKPWEKQKRKIKWSPTEEKDEKNRTS